MDKSYVLAVDITEFPELSLERFVPRSGTGTRSKKTNLGCLYRLLGVNGTAECKEKGAWHEEQSAESKNSFFGVHCLRLSNDLIRPLEHINGNRQTDLFCCL